MPALVLIHPDIPQNLGGILRLCACLSLPLHIIEPCGFPLDDARLRRAGMDYIQHAELHRHASWERFQSSLCSPLAGEPQSTSKAKGDAVGGQSLSPHGTHKPTLASSRSPSGGEHKKKRLILVETDGEKSLDNFTFQPNDYIIFGSESAGTPRALYADMDVTLRIPMHPEMRSLNLAMSAGMVAFEAYRQLQWELA